MSVDLLPYMAAKANSCQSVFVLVLTHSSSAMQGHSFLFKGNSKKLLKRKRFSMALDEEEEADQCTQSKSTALMANYTSALFMTELSFIIYNLNLNSKS